MVLGKCALYVACVVVVGSAYGQFASPLVVLPPANTDPSCVRLYEQRTNGNNFVTLCGANAITTNNAITLPNLTAGGVLLAAPTAAAPVGSFYATNMFNELNKICYPGTVFATCWTMQTVAASGGGKLEFLDSAGVNFFTFDGTNNSLLTENVLPKTASTFNLGSALFPWSNFFGTVVTSGDVNVSSNLKVSSIGGLIQCVEATSAGIFYGTGAPCASGGGVTSLAATSPITTTGATGAITIACGTCATTGVGASVSFLTVTSPDGSFDRVAITNPGAGSDTGAGITQLNAAGGIVFKTFYNGNIQTAYTGGGNVVACFNSTGVLFRGASTTSC